MNRNWTSSVGAGNTRYGSEISGIPDVKPSWNYVEVKDGASPVLTKSVIYDNGFYFQGGYGYVGKLDFNNGKIKWLFQQETTNSAVICTNGRHIVVEPFIFDTNTGRVLLDYHDILCGYEKQKNPRPALNDYWMVKSWQEMEEDYSMLAIKLDGMAARRIENGVRWPELIGESTHVAGITNQGMARFDIAKEEFIWKTDIGRENSSKPGVTAVFDKVLVVSLDGRYYVLDSDSGELLHSFNQKTVSRELPDGWLSRAITDQHFYIYGNQISKLYCYDFLNQGRLFSLEISGLRDFCVAGDLIFALRDVDSSYSAAIALDRYTGEQVWQAEEPIRVAYDIKACGNKVVVNTVGGLVRCFEWKEVYTSPNKDRWVPKVIG